MTMITGKGIEGFQLVRLKAALGLEIAGLKNSRGSVYAHVKRTYGFKGNKQKVYNQLVEYIKKFNEENGFGPK